MDTILKIFILFSIFMSVSSDERLNNVCPRAKDYNTKFYNPNCRYEPDADAFQDTDDIVLSHGYTFESYDIVTKDGYILELHRIGKKERNKFAQPILLMHGILASSGFWVVNGNRSIGFILADQGYDVWLGNSRGTTYGKRHVKLSTRNPQFWKFSFHEMGIYDLPSMLDKIIAITGRNDILYVAHSMGANMLMVYASEFPEEAKSKLKYYYFLAPGVYLINLKTPLASLTKYWRIIEKFLKSLGMYELLPKLYTYELNEKICLNSAVMFTFCELIGSLVVGPDIENVPPDMFAVLLSQFPAGTSLQTVVHLSQDIASKKFAKYDYGFTRNLLYYRSIKPPSYDLSKVAIPGHIMYGENDWLVTEDGAHTLHKNLRGTATIFRVNDDKYNHIDFFFATNADVEIVFPLLKIIDKYKN